MSKMPTERRIVEGCACHRIRMAARAVTRSYDEALRPIGLRATQLAVLASVALEGAMSIRALAEAMGMDRSTLSRNLAPLEKEGLLAVGDEGWRRSRTLRVTASGRAKLRKALPLWEEAQRRLREELGARRWGEVRESLDSVIGSASRSRARKGT